MFERDGVASFGPHLMIDGRQCNSSRIGDMAYIWQVLDDLPERIGMTKIIPPYVFPYSGLVPEDRGVTGVVVIAESHITIHTFTEKDYIFCDVFSCRSFDEETAVQYLVDAFGIVEYNLHRTERGANFPREQ